MLGHDTSPSAAGPSNHNRGNNEQQHHAEDEPE
jgi:hypothetical protein